MYTHYFFSRVTSSYCCKDENCVVLGPYTVSSSNCLPTFWDNLHSRIQSFWPDQLFKVTEIKQLCYFSTVSLYFNTLFNWYINLTIDGTIHPSQHFPLGVAFVHRAGNFWTILRVHWFHLQGSPHNGPEEQFSTLLQMLWSTCSGEQGQRTYNPTKWSISVYNCNLK